MANRISLFRSSRYGSMGFTLYSLIEAGLLMVNAIAILNEKRFLSRWSGGTAARAAPGGYPGAGGYGDDYGNGGGGAGAASQLLNLIRSVRTVMRVPLIAFNVITIILLVLFG